MADSLHPTSQAPKPRSGCLLALYIFLGLGVLILVTAGIGLWLFLRSERGQKLMEVAGDGISLAREVARAPGTDALRAAGCAQAMIIPTSHVLKLVGAFAPDARRELPEAFADGTLVMCQLTGGDGEGPDCAQVARIYADAVSEAPERFGVIVQHQRQQQARCQGAYARDGSFVGSLERP